MEAFFKKIESFFCTDPELCVQCHRAAANKVFVVRHEDVKLLFCSDKCIHNYWKEYGQWQHVARQQRSPTCRYPGCAKPCYQEGTKVYDYCGRTHATEHLAMMGRGYHRQHSGNSQTYSSGSRNFPWHNSTGPIRFYNRGEPYYEFTNFYEAVVKIDNEDWLTTEHYFQAQKFVGTPLVGTIQMLERPREAFEKSRDPRYSKWRRSDWEAVKEDVMYKALQAKFTQHEKLRRKLLETGERELIEHSPHDSYWGDGGNGTGMNRLGELLMKLRREMKKEKQPVQPPQPSPPPVRQEPPKQQPTMGNSPNSNEPTTQPKLDQHKGPTGEPSGDTAQRSRPSPPHGRQCTNDLSTTTVIANEGAGAQLPVNTGQNYSVIFTPSSKPIDSQPNQAGSWQANDLSELTRKPLNSTPLSSPGYPERVHSHPSTTHSYADAVRGSQPQQSPSSIGVPIAQTQPSPHLQNNHMEGGTQPQPLGLQSPPTYPPSVGAHTQSSHEQNNLNNLGEGGPQPQPGNDVEDMDTSV